MIYNFIYADILGVSVGKNVWPHIAEPLAKAISERNSITITQPSYFFTINRLKSKFIGFYF